MDLLQAIAAAPTDPGQTMTDAWARRIAHEITEAVGAQQSRVRAASDQATAAEARAAAFETMIRVLLDGQEPHPQISLDDFHIRPGLGWWHSESGLFAIAAGARPVELVAHAPEEFSLISNPTAALDLEPGETDDYLDSPLHEVIEVDGKQLVFERQLSYRPGWTPASAIPPWLAEATNPDLVSGG